MAETKDKIHYIVTSYKLLSLFLHGCWTVCIQPITTILTNGEKKPSTTTTTTNAFLPFTHYSFKCDESHLMQKWNEIDQRNHHHFALWVERSRLKITIKLVRSNHSCAVIKSIDINKLPAISLFAVIVIVFVVVLFFRHFICLCKMVGCCTCT